MLHNLPAGNWEAGERGIACHPGRVGEFQEGVGRAISYAKALGPFDLPGFFLSGTRQALDIIAATGADNLLLQYDVYHMQRMEGELAKTLESNLAQIGHIQLADNPGRNEPGTGEINYAFLFRHIDALGYDGWIGCEYKPATTTAAGLLWLAPYR